MNYATTLMMCFVLAVTVSARAEIEPAPAPVGEAQLIELTAKVEDVDLEERRITVKKPDGGVLTSKVDSRVTNLDQVKAGDEVHVKFYRAILEKAEIVSEDAMRTGKVTGMAARAVGEVPAGVVAREVRETVEILLVDPYKKAIAFRDMSGRFREISVDAPHLEHWLTDLKKGDKVRIAYQEALAVAVEPK